MHLGVPTTSYPRHRGDVAGAFVRELCLALVDRGHRVEVLAPDDPAALDLRDDGVQVTRLEARAPGLGRAFYGAGFPDNIARDPTALVSAGVFVGALLQALAARPRFDAIISHWALPCALATRLVSRVHPHVAVWHSGDVSLARRLLGASAWRRLRPIADEHVFVAEHLRDRLGARGRGVVIPMGIRPPGRPPDRAPSGARRFSALVLARLVPIKRIELAIEACVEASVPLVVAGEGPERARLERLARDRGGDVRFVGVLDGERKEQAFRSADVFLSTSACSASGPSEGYPVAPREALAHGLVVLATDDPVHRELARRCSPSVVLAPREALARRLAELRRSRERFDALARAAPGSVEGDAWPRIAERFEALVQSSTRRASGRGERISALGSIRAG